ncbi:MAG: hypothetical protein LCH41_04865 [Armatimonadetes bacterium]|nr:hypothetical protein [Armatimonadota bacterium]
MKEPRLLILSASTGNGHMSAAGALEAEAKSQGLWAQAVDVLDHVPKGFRAWYRGGYEQLVRKNPRTWGHLYKTSDRPLFNYQVQTVMDRQFTRRIHHLIAETKPDWVVCTHSLPQPRLAVARKLYGFRMAIVVTDLYVHRMWLRGKPDHFFVPQEWSADVLEKRIPGSRAITDVTGIPIHPLFTQPIDRAAFRAAHGIPDSATVALISSGGIGGGPMADATDAVLNAGGHAVLITGRHEAATRAMTQRYGGNSGVTVLGSIPQADMAAWMQSSEFLVSKPGGLTTFEALASGLPFLVFWPFLIPGQEEGNAEFLEEQGAGMIARNVADLRYMARRLVDQPETRSEMRRCALAQAIPDSTQRIIGRLREL